MFESNPMTGFGPRPSSNRPITNSREMTNQINNHSFRDIELVPITPWIEPADLKDPKAARDAKTPVIKNKYSVSVFKI